MKRSRKAHIERIESLIRALKASNRAGLKAIYMAKGGMCPCTWRVLYDAYVVKMERRLNRICQLIRISVKLQSDERQARWMAKIDRKYPLSKR